jgi:molybdate transport system substrate-binding protein
MKVLRACIALVLGSALVTGCSSADEPGADGANSTVRIAAASDLRFALEEITSITEQEHPEIDIAVTYGSSGQFVQQIQNGAPFDLYLSADRAYVDDLVDEGLVERADVFEYAVGRLVTWYPDGAPSTPDLDGLTDAKVRTVAIANPEHAPYGRAAIAALDSTDLLPTVEPKLVLGENVAQAAEFARTGNADAAIIALSLVLAEPVRDVGEWTEVPLDTFPRLVQAGAVLSGAQDPDAARIVGETITGDAGRDILAAYGFSFPDEP